MCDLVSVIIPSYNRQKTICRAIDSVINQSYTNIEVIVVDDGSTDNTLQLLEKYGDKIKVLKQEHKGANAARNKGIREAKGSYIAFQDSDDEWLPDKLYKQMKYINDNRYMVCYCPFELIDDGTKKIMPHNYKNQVKYETNLSDTLQKGSVISTQTLLVKKDVFDDIGIFDEDMPRLQDYELVIRIVKKYKIGYCAECLVRVYRDSDSISKNYDKYKKAAYLLLKKHSDFVDYETIINDLYWEGFFENEVIDLDYLLDLMRISDFSEKAIRQVILFIHQKHYHELTEKKEGLAAKDKYIKALEKDRAEGFAAKDKYIKDLEKDRAEGLAAKDKYIEELEKDRDEGLTAKDKYIAELEKDRDEGLAAKDKYIEELEKDKEEGFAAKDKYIEDLEKNKAEGLAAKDKYIAELEKNRAEGFAEKDKYIEDLERDRLEGLAAKDKYIEELEKDRAEGFAEKDKYIEELEKDKAEGLAAKDKYIEELEKDKAEGLAAKDKYIAELEKDRAEGFAAKDKYIEELEKDRAEGFAIKDAYIKELEHNMIEGFRERDSCIESVQKELAIMSEKI